MRRGSPVLPFGVRDFGVLSARFAGLVGCLGLSGRWGTLFVIGVLVLDGREGRKVVDVVLGEL